MKKLVNAAVLVGAVLLAQPAGALSMHTVDGTCEHRFHSTTGNSGILVVTAKATASPPTAESIFVTCTVSSSAGGSVTATSEAGAGAATVAVNQGNVTNGTYTCTLWAFASWDLPTPGSDSDTGC